MTILEIVNSSSGFQIIITFVSMDEIIYNK